MTMNGNISYLVRIISLKNGIDRLVYKIKDENILLECVQATDIEHNIADIFNMNNNYRNAF